LHSRVMTAVVAKGTSVDSSSSPPSDTSVTLASSLVFASCCGVTTGDAALPSVVAASTDSFVSNQLEAPARICFPAPFAAPVPPWPLLPASTIAANEWGSGPTPASWFGVGTEGGMAGGSPAGSGIATGNIQQLPLELERIDEELVRHGDRLRVRLVAALRQDHLCELLRDVDIRLFQRRADE